MNRLFHSSSSLNSLRSMLIAAAATVALSASASADFIKQTNIITSDPVGHPAKFTDPNLVNAWGMSYPPGGPIWISDNGKGVTTLYHVDPATDTPSPVLFPITIPGDGSATGQTFNSGAASGAFNGDAFLFVSEDGTVSGWRGSLANNHMAETLQVGSTSNIYKGTTMAVVGGHSYLYAANFATGNVDVLKGDVGAPNLAGHFVDPTLPTGYGAFNVQVLGNHIFVTYAQQTGTVDEKDGAGLGLVNEFNLDGTFVGRVASNGGVLDAPWGLAMAPADFGKFAGDLLVGNFGNGTIDAFNLSTMSFDGWLTNQNGGPLTIDGLWGLIPGNGGIGGNTGRLYFSAGPDGESQGLFGSLSFVPEPASLSLVLAGLLAFGWRRRKTASA